MPENLSANEGEIWFYKLIVTTCGEQLDRMPILSCISWLGNNIAAEHLLTCMKCCAVAWKRTYQFQNVGTHI